ncbi:hypothetical protein CSUI_007364 [Cystoisospora suis]|uniref:Uncharacterized protein n=1 Tax=Cystoisospora suis TaxID=483139 RepID=A0A2C6KNW4_9APIC|nr:hypothetical protein CSUI_007364 [Cystoisospora suis]
MKEQQTASTSVVPGRFRLMAGAKELMYENCNIPIPFWGAGNKEPPLLCYPGETVPRKRMPRLLEKRALTWKMSYRGSSSGTPGRCPL